jgi:ubiquinone biosynthesis protein Coq4
VVSPGATRKVSVGRVTLAPHFVQTYLDESHDSYHRVACHNAITVDGE